MAITAAIPSGYLSFLVCLHEHGTSRRVVNVYLNGQPVGVVNASGTFHPHSRPMADGSKRPLQFRDVAEPCPFASLAELKAFLRDVVERIELVDPAAEAAAPEKGA